MESALDFHTAKALLEWQIELGATECIGADPVNRYEMPAKAPKPLAPANEPAPVAAAPKVDPVQVAKAAADGANNLETLRDAMDSFAHCDLRNGARSLVFSDGMPHARVMVVGEAPGRDEDMQGKPFVGRAGQLLDRMFAAIEMRRDAPDRDKAIYIANVLPWRPPQNRDPKPDEVAMMLPFLERHIELANPDVLVLMGNHSCNALLGRRGITRLRGNWQEVLGKPAMPMFHPAYLLRNPVAKREAWHDLLSLQSKLRDMA